MPGTKTTVRLEQMPVGVGDEQEQTQNYEFSDFDPALNGSHSGESEIAALSEADAGWSEGASRS
jgi:hypothetical protein